MLSVECQFSYFAGTILPGFLWSLGLIHHQIMLVWIMTESVRMTRLWWWSALPPPPAPPAAPPPPRQTPRTRTARTRAGILSPGGESLLATAVVTNISLSRTDVKKLQEVRSSGEICDVNIILTNPDLLHLCGDEADVENRNQESSPERTSYR